MLKLGFHWI